MGDITPKERVFRAINCEDVDKIPVVPQLTFAAAKYRVDSISEALVDPQLQLEALLYAQKQCGYDGIYANWESSTVLIADAMGSDIIIFEDISPRIKEPLVQSPESVKNNPPQPMLARPRMANIKKKNWSGAVGGINKITEQQSEIMMPIKK